MDPKTKNILLIIFVIAQLLDILTTVLGIKYLSGREINPFLQGMMPFQIAVIKFIIVSLIYVVLKQNHYEEWVYWLVVIFSAFPVLINGLQMGLHMAIINSAGT